MITIQIFDMTQKTYHIDNFLWSSSKFFLLKNTFKVALQYLFNVFYYLIHFLILNLTLN